MSEKYKIRNQEAMYFATMTAVGWVDLFTRPELNTSLLIHFGIAKKKGLDHSCLVPNAKSFAFNHQFIKRFIRYSS